MKRFISLALLLLVASAAPAQMKVWLANDSSYTATDTTAWVNIDPMRFYSAVFVSQDSCNLELAIDYRVSDTTSAARAVTQFGTWIMQDSTNITDANGAVKGYVVRDANTDNIPGANLVRLRATRKTTKNGVAGPRLYDLYFLRGTGGK